jgi:hypothetical protein
MADEIWEYYARDAQRAIETIAERLRQVTVERDRWRDIAYEYYLTDTDCSCHICDLYRKAAGIDNETV